MARSKIRKSNSALSRGQMVRIEQFPIITFVVDPLAHRQQHSQSVLIAKSAQD
jgi:hypothetical protein